jgi:UDP-N-acetylglucosamine 3-dehydrogenase
VFRVGLFGAGTMGSTHAWSYTSLPGVELAAICEKRVDQAKRVADMVGAPNAVISEDPDTILKDDSINVVSVCLPTPFHKEFVLKAIKAGKHVFCEKPIARSIEDAREMAAAAEAAGVRFTVGHVVRFFPEYAKAKELISSGAVGKPAIVRTTRASGFPRFAWSDWYSKYEWSGGVVLDMIVHDFDWLCWTFGKPTRVFAKGLGNKGLEHLDYALVTIRFENGVIAHVEGSWAYPGNFTTKLEVAGTEGLLDIQSPLTYPIKLETRKTAEQTAGVAVPESPTAESPFLIEDRHFFNNIQSGEPFLVKPEDAVLAAEVAFAALKSIETGAVVNIG